MRRSIASFTESVSPRMLASEDSTELAMSTRPTMSRTTMTKNTSAASEAAREVGTGAEDPGHDGVEQERQDPGHEEHGDDGEEGLDDLGEQEQRRRGRRRRGRSRTVQWSGQSFDVGQAHVHAHGSSREAPGTAAQRCVSCILQRPCDVWFVQCEMFVPTERSAMTGCIHRASSMARIIDTFERLRAADQRDPHRDPARRGRHDAAGQGAPRRRGRPGHRGDRARGAPGRRSVDHQRQHRPADRDGPRRPAPRRPSTGVT